MAVASETLNSQKGRVEVLRSSDVGLFAWELAGTFDGGTGDRLGYSLAIDHAGSRIAFGMPFNNGSTGMVRVHEYDGSEWVQVGTDLVGKSVVSLFGRSHDMSADGKTIVAGATGSYADGGITTNARGSILVYEEVDGVWQQVGVDLEGDATKEQFGRAVTMDSTGTRIAASSFKYNGHKGRVKVFNYNNETTGGWDMIIEVNGEATHERMGRGLSSLAMSNNGKILAIGSPLEDTGTNKTGKVLVVEEQDITSQPSGAPSTVPSVEPISEPSSQPSILPSLTPSNKPSDTNTIVPSSHPSYTPSSQPSLIPSGDPSVGPSRSPSTRPSDDPSTIPSSEPSAFPSLAPSNIPTEDPSSHPSQTPSFQPSPVPSGDPSVGPSSSSSTRPSDGPLTIPSSEPSFIPSTSPSDYIHQLVLVKFLRAGQHPCLVLTPVRIHQVSRVSGHLPPPVLVQTECHRPRRQKLLLRRSDRALRRVLFLETIASS
uniref:Circumsporozoite protein n=1 Tax=Attheya septentrionalis TaxID=420275 RepID=A0A7S2UTC9_9STRA|mmetsp:Transcript_8235/g.14879  ORF Transcript_8235/g.14879 Transcript_8235/m.14879 type:complete len:485 (+) Transcript_8235:493-1947(+)